MYLHEKFDLVQQTVLPHERVGSGDETKATVSFGDSNMPFGSNMMFCCDVFAKGCLSAVCNFSKVVCR